MTFEVDEQEAKKRTLEAMSAEFRAAGFENAEARSRYRRKHRGSALVNGDVTGIPATVLLATSQEAVVRQQERARDLAGITKMPTYAVVRRRYGMQMKDANVTLSLSQFANLLHDAYGSR